MGIPHKELREPRVATRQNAILIDSDGGQLPVTIIDLSARGFRLRSHETLVIGEHVRLRVGKSGEYPAQIRWVLGDEAGGTFLDERR